ncbi:hypothetical protein [Janthinobacterium sp.]|uniref:hypothetical protein n=1 Tax=Janthinobacterium sp. TaxID=1871054 RepID=UPI002608CE72|nr:hypothetical protein [Janthinobacterium sp.]
MASAMTAWPLPNNPSKYGWLASYLLSVGKFVYSSLVMAACLCKIVAYQVHMSLQTEEVDEALKYKTPDAAHRAFMPP